MLSLMLGVLIVVLAAQSLLAIVDSHQSKFRQVAQKGRLYSIGVAPFLLLLWVISHLLRALAWINPIVRALIKLVIWTALSFIMFFLVINIIVGSSGNSEGVGLIAFLLALVVGIGSITSYGQRLADQPKKAIFSANKISEKFFNIETYLHLLVSMKNIIVSPFKRLNKLLETREKVIVGLVVLSLGIQFLPIFTAKWLFFSWDASIDQLSMTHILLFAAIDIVWPVFLYQMLFRRNTKFGWVVVYLSGISTFLLILVGFVGVSLSYKFMGFTVNITDSVGLQILAINHIAIQVVATEYLYTLDTRRKIAHSSCPNEL